MKNTGCYLLAIRIANRLCSNDVYNLEYIDFVDVERDKNNKIALINFVFYYEFGVRVYVFIDNNGRMFFARSSFGEVIRGETSSI